MNFPVADYRNGNIIIHRIQNIKRTICLDFKNKTGRTCQHNGKENAKWLQKGTKTGCIRSPTMHSGYNHR